MRIIADCARDVNYCNVRHILLFRPGICGFSLSEFLGHIYIYLEIRFSYVENYNKNVQPLTTKMCWL